MRKNEGSFICCDNCAATPTPIMSIYRAFNRIPIDELHHFERRRKDSNERVDQDASYWLSRRKAKPCEHLLATTSAWCNALPVALHPTVLCACFPRIANGLASGWRDRDATARYFDDLLTDRRGGRRGLPGDVLEQLHALKTYYEDACVRRDFDRRR